MGLGAFIGCLPLYGAHLALCFGLARLFGLNRLTTYLAAHVNNPLTAAGLLSAEIGVGHRLLHGAWPVPAIGELRRLSLLGIGRDLAVGAVVLGLALGGVLATVAYIVARDARGTGSWLRLVEATARRYLDCGVAHWEFARGKLRSDPLYREVVRRVEAAPRRRILDLGCGRGLALALIDTAWPAAAHDLVGVDRRASLIAIARRALGDRARLEVADLQVWSPPVADLVLLLDVLHYLPVAAQREALDRVAAALMPGGILLVREADRAGGARFLLTRAGERMSALMRGHLRQRFHYRSASEWAALLAASGLDVETAPLSQGTPFANVLLAARRPGSA